MLKLRVKGRGSNGNDCALVGGESMLMLWSRGINVNVAG